MTGIDFHNKTANSLTLWIELACIELELEKQTEYRIEAEDTEFRIEFKESMIVLWLQHAGGPKVFRRPYSTHSGQAKWELLIDLSAI
ncbi:hypothetical protein K3G63_05340 [Hymenobacter sp. HSC-4F20]|uniref:hypothetical protein n=1 Tax=Hymenobacter sp. HSC-4F20 TaxID=2864135 RepID=UPI001C73C0D1|nr:hypothetical protein [Hymenobacter sp. HSC-4F20]MBX0289851.1 hypothetical protein [Hymenobacter sp. HSC-4F20]